jgi:hypothetical protein
MSTAGGVIEKNTTLVGLLNLQAIELFSTRVVRFFDASAQR